MPVSQQYIRFFHISSKSLGILAALAVGVTLSACKPGGSADSGSDASVAERIKPFGQVVVEGQDTAGPASAPEAAAPAAAEPAAVAATAAGSAAAPAAAATTAAAVDGAATYQSACSVCHGMGIAGAPKLGDKAAWSARIAQGEAVLHKHSLEGYQGATGVMPAKGGRMDLSDAAVIAAVDHMVAQSR